jgi:hypothetical protein
VFFRDHPCFCKYCLLGNYERCLNKAIIGGWEKRKVKPKAFQRPEPTNLTKVQQFFKSYNYNHHAYAIIIAVIETNKPIDDDPEAEQTVNLKFFELKSSLEKQTKALTIDDTKPGIQFEMPLTQDSFAVNGVPLCRDGNSWNLRKAVGVDSVWIPWNKIILTPDILDPNSSHNPFHYLGQSPYRREYDSSFSSSLVYSIDGTCVEKLVDFVLN